MMGIRNVDSRFRTAYAAAEELGPPPRAEKRCQAGTRINQSMNPSIDQSRDASLNESID